MRSALVRAAAVGGVGAGGTLALTAAFNIDRLGEGLPPQAVVASLVAGFILAALLEVLVEIGRSTAELIAEVSRLTDSVRAQSAVLDLVKDAKKHAATIGPLLADDRTARFQVTAVNEARYLQFVRPVLERSDTFHGVQRRPLRWFAETEGGLEYLRCLRHRRMHEKTRIFVIDEADEPAMVADLANEGMLSEHFASTGKDVRTCWIRASWFKGRGLAVPYDYALLDSELMITWDGTSALTFRFVHEKSPELDVFAFLRELGTGRGSPFTEVKPPRVAPAPGHAMDPWPSPSVSAPREQPVSAAGPDTS